MIRENRPDLRRLADEPVAEIVQCGEPISSLLPFANTSNGLTKVGERLPRSNVEFDTSVLIKRACSCGFFATYEE